MTSPSPGAVQSGSNVGLIQSCGALGTKQLALMLWGKTPKPGAPAPHKLRFELDGHPRRRQPATSAWARVMAENLQPNEGWLEPRPRALASYPVRAMSSALRSSQAQWLPTRYHSAWTSNPYIEREYIRDIFGKELVCAMPVWNLLERQFNVFTRRFKENKGLRYF